MLRLSRQNVSIRPQFCLVNSNERNITKQAGDNTNHNDRVNKIIQLHMRKCLIRWWGMRLSVTDYALFETWLVLMDRVGILPVYQESSAVAGSIHLWLLDCSHTFSLGYTLCFRVIIFFLLQWMSNKAWMPPSVRQNDLFLLIVPMIILSRVNAEISHKLCLTFMIFNLLLLLYDLYIVIMADVHLEYLPSNKRRETVWFMSEFIVISIDFNIFNYH